MNTPRNKLSEAVRYGLVVGAAGFIGFGAAPAVAQTDDAARLDRIEVTGSRIRQIDVETAQPVLVISRDTIENQGFQSVTDILQNISATGAPPLSRAAPLSSGEAAGGQFVSMRNLGATRTLVLVNGKRLGINTGGTADISNIPLAAIDRIEVLKDGASSLYGSDAIGGVVNIITRSRFEGMQATAYVGQYQPWDDGQVEKYDLLMGQTGERGSLTMVVEYGSEKDVPASNRPFSAFPRSDRYPTLGWTPVGQFGGFVTNNAAGRAVPGVATGQRVIVRPGGDPSNPADYILQSAGPNNGGTSNTNEQTSLRSGIERRAIFVSGDFDLTDSIRFVADATYSHRDTDRQIAGYPYQAAAFATILTPSGRGTPLAANSFFNPYRNSATPTAIPNWWRRSWEVPRTATSDLTTYRFNAALQGNFDWADRYFDWDIGYTYQDNRVVQQGFGDLNIANVAAAVGPSFLNAAGQVQCGTPAAPIPLGSGPGSCVPWNPFLEFGRVGPGGLTDNAMLQEFLFQNVHNTGRTTTQVASINLSGLVWTLPAGDLQFAIGAERRKESGAFIPDAMAVTGNSSTLASRPTVGGYNIDELYAELAIPLLADIAFAKELSLSLSSRYSDFDTFGDTTNSKVGLTWRPVDDVLVRGTWSEGFRAPTIFNLFAGGSQTFAFYTDPCDTVFGSSTPGSAVRAACAADARIPNAATFRQLGQGFVPITAAPAQTPLAFFSGAANPDLGPENSVGRTAGIVWSPRWVEGLSLGLDWWKIRIENTIVGDSPGQILSDCYIDRIQSRCSPALFTRDPAQGGLVTAMQWGSRNAGFREVEGWDFDVQYRMAPTAFGDFALNWQTTYTSADEFKSTDDPRVLSSPQVGFGSNFRIRSNAQLSWNFGDFGATWGARYYSAVKESCLSIAIAPDECNIPGYVSRTGAVSNLNRVGSNTFNDVQVRWQAPWNATISLGANNVFNHLGPPMYGQPNANVSYHGEFDIGRFVYARYQQRF
jgi:iron complex outermembrane recepter protein